MKNLFIIIFFGVNLLSIQVAQGQCLCNFAMTAEIDPNNPCCVVIRLCGNGGPGCNTTQYNRIQWKSNVFPPYLGIVTGATSSNANITATIDDPYTVTFTTSMPYNSIINTTGCSLPSDYAEIGTICLQNFQPGAVPVFELSVLAQPGQECLIPASESVSISCDVPKNDLSKIYGDANNNFPQKIKHFDDGFYVAGVREDMGLNYATFSKFDIVTGALVWDFTMMEPSVFNDFAFDINTGEIMLVGATEPAVINGVPQNNESILVRVNATGSLVYSKRYQQTGRESFNRIIRHPNTSLTFPYFILGTKNPPGTPPYPTPPSDVDRVFVISMDDAGTLGWAKEFDYDGSNSPNDEFALGIFPRTTGNASTNRNIIITGYDPQNQDGILVEINGLLGNIASAKRYDEPVKIYDGMNIGGGTYVLVGQDVVSGKAFYERVGSNFQHLDGKLFDEIKEFREVTIDGQGSLYTCGHKISDNTPVIHKLSSSEEWSLLDGETDWRNCHLSVDFGFRIFYADARLNNPSGFGNWDMLVGDFDLTLNSQCKQVLNLQKSNFSLTDHPITITSTDMSLPTPGTVNDAPLNYSCNDFCNPIQVVCEADFTFSPNQQGCYTVSFSAQATGAAPLSYCWDVNGTPATCEYTTASFLYNFQNCGNYNVCLTITAADGCTDTHCEMVTVIDVIPPVIQNCPTAINLTANSATCTACINTPLLNLLDNCGNVPFVQCFLTGATTGNYAFGVGCYNIGTTTVTCTAFDNCFNPSLPCTFKVVVADSNPFQVTCQNQTVDMAAGQCFATVTPNVTVTSNCSSPTYTASCVYTHSTLGTTVTGSPAQLGLGLWNATCTVISGGLPQVCNYTVNVVDNQAPVANCPPSQTINVPGCSNGSIATFASPTFTDNCGIASQSCSPNFQSGDFFPCGPTTITCTATDVAGNIANCSFTVNVTGCNDCANILNYEIFCTDIEGCYEFAIHANNLTSLPFSTAAVTPTAVGGATLSNFVWDASTGTATGKLTIAPPLPLQLQVNLTFDFPCPFGQIVCTRSVVMTTPCCEEISVADLSVCKSDPILHVPINGPFSLQADAVQVDWYVAVEPCTNYVLYQSSAAWADLVLLPSYFPASVNKLCVYAVVTLSNNPCQTLTSNTAMITLCGTSNCSMSMASPSSHCYFGTPIVVDPLKVTVGELDCDYSVQWYFNGSPIPGETGDSYQPPALSHITDSNGDCYTVYNYTAEVSNLCGTETCDTSITIYNDAAPEGLLDMIYPSISQPFCPGQDATLRYVPQCVGPDPYKWEWCISTDGGNYSNIIGSGTINPVYNTNQLFVDTWYKVKKNNGVCPEDETAFMIDIIDDLNITSFTATQDDPCNPTSVNMQLDFTSDCNTFFNVEWYKDGSLIGTTTHTASPATFNYSTTPLDGNYYAIVQDDCCSRRIKSNIVTIEPPCEAIMVAPCFRCNDQSVTLEGMLINQPSGVGCTY